MLRLFLPNFFFLPLTGNIISDINYSFFGHTPFQMFFNKIVAFNDVRTIILNNVMILIMR